MDIWRKSVFLDPPPGVPGFNKRIPVGTTIDIWFPKTPPPPRVNRMSLANDLSLSKHPRSDSDSWKMTRVQPVKCSQTLYLTESPYQISVNRYPLLMIQDKREPFIPEEKFDQWRSFLLRVKFLTKKMCIDIPVSYFQTNTRTLAIPYSQYHWPGDCSRLTKKCQIIGWTLPYKLKNLIKLFGLITDYL